MRLNNARRLLNRLLFVGLIGVGLAIASAPVAGASEKSQRVGRSLNTLDNWLGSSSYGDTWNEFLMTTVLREQLEKGEDADAATVKTILEQYQSGASGLGKARFVAVRHALVAWLAELSIVRRDQLSAAAAEAKDGFVAATSRQVAEAKARVRASAGRLNSFLARNPRRARGWKDYLKWDVLQDQLRAQASDAAKLRDVIQRLSENEPGLEIPRFKELRRNLVKWKDTQLSATRPDVLRDRVESYVGELSEQLAEYGPTSSHWDALDIGARVNFMDRFNVAPHLTSAVRRHHSHPNLTAYVSEDLIAAGLHQDVNQPVSLRDTIMGVFVVGHGHTNGRIEVSLIPDSNKAVFDLHMSGVTHARTTGYKRSVQIHSQSATQLSAHKRLEFGPTGLSSRPAKAWASTSTNTTGVTTRRGSRLVERIVWKKVAQGKSQAEAIGSAKARRKLSEQVDGQASKLVADANDKYQSKFRNPLLRKDAFPTVFDVHTTDAAILIQMLEATAEQLAAPSPPLPPPPGSDTALRVHESFVNNFAAVALGGTTFRSEDAANSSSGSDLLKKLKAQREESLQARREAEGRPEPKKVDDSEAPPPFEMTFAKKNPITVEFRDGTIKFVLRGVRFVGIDDVVRTNKMSMWGVYKIEIDKYGGLRLTLQEQGVDPTSVEAGGKFVAADAAIRSKLRARMTAALEGENGENKVVEIFPLEIPAERWKAIGPMAYTHVESKDGWLTLALDRVSKLEQKQAAAEDAPSNVARKPAEDATPQR